MSRPGIAILDDYHGVALASADWSVIARTCRIEVFRRPLGVPDEAAEVLAPFAILCTLRERMAIPRALIERLPNLRHIVVTGKRYDAIDVAAAAERDVSVSTCPPAPGVGPGAVVELVWALILAAARRLPYEDRSLRRGVWQAGGPGMTLAGRRLGVVGLGQLGRRVAALGRAFGMDVVAWSPNLTEAAAAEGGARLVSRREIFATSDVVTLHLVLGERSRGLVGRDDLFAMKPTAILVNAARAGLVDEPALIDALRRGAIGAAALDVYLEEPLPPSHPFLAMDNVVLSPHLGYYTAETLRGYYRGAVENIAAFLSGAPIRLVPVPPSPESA